MFFVFYLIFCFLIYLNWFDILYMFLLSWILFYFLIFFEKLLLRTLYKIVYNRSQYSVNAVRYTSILNRASVLYLCKLSQLFCWILIIANTKLPPHFPPVSNYWALQHWQLQGTRNNTHTHTRWAAEHWCAITLLQLRLYCKAGHYGGFALIAIKKMGQISFHMHMQFRYCVSHSGQKYSVLTPYVMLLCMWCALVT